jgi:hypothetical protein
VIKVLKTLFVLVIIIAVVFTDLCLRESETAVPLPNFTAKLITKHFWTGPIVYKRARGSFELLFGFHQLPRLRRTEHYKEAGY